MRRNNVKVSFGRAPLGANVRENSFDWKLIVFVGYIITLAYEGPIRWLFSVAHIETLLYLRDVFALIVVLGVTFGQNQRRSGYVNVAGIFFYAICCHSILGLWIGHPLPAVLFAFKIFLAFFVGLSCGSYLGINRNFFLKFLFILFGTSCLGVYVNHFYGMFPWEGAQFESAFGTVANRLWWADGERRLPGLARVSTTAGAAIGMTGVFVICYARNVFIKALAFAAGFSAIWLTTSKGVLLSFAIVGFWGFLPHGEFKRKAGVALLWFNVFAAIVVPFVGVYCDINPLFMRMVPGFVTSFVERMAITWPGALENMDHWYFWLIGQGFGGIGGALRMGGDLGRFNPIDNLFLYSYVNFGLLGVFYYFFAAWNIGRVVEVDREGDDSYSLAVLAMGIHFFCYGITAHQVEDAFESMWFGLIVMCRPVSLALLNTWRAGHVSHKAI